MPMMSKSTPLWLSDGRMFHTIVDVRLVITPGSSGFWLINTFSHEAKATKPASQPYSTFLKPEKIASHKINSSSSRRVPELELTQFRNSATKPTTQKWPENSKHRYESEDVKGVILIDPSCGLSLGVRGVAHNGDAPYIRWYCNKEGIDTAKIDYRD
ncbi:hypothetical protein TRICI_001182 [Trichomonascus ciferrii]|uniref:Uncharacterized protein n=1 Tax=Trichomonascus ciferrii TaxID=44093 RepID=A0A642VBC9_9ASCO|nr:hypothetical protein TRICI_001182 [Trichomonascus ciferrii]